MTAQEYIEYKLKELAISEQTAPSFASDKDLHDYIFKVIMSKKFRKFKVTTEYLPHIHEAIEDSIQNNLPIKFAFPFGGYKLWRLEETPEADWAELFTLMYYAKWLKPIAEVYKPGIWFDFCSDDVIVERMNNIPNSDTERYRETFNMTIDFLKKYIPENMKFTMTPVSSHYTPEEFEEDLQDKIERMEEELGGLPVLDERKKAMIELNVKLKPGQGEDALWREKVELIHKAYYNVSRRRPYSRAKDKILTFCMKMDNCVCVGTTKSSTAKFWVGVGVLKKGDMDFQELVLSPSQVESSSFIKEDIAMSGLEGKNFKSINVMI